MAVPKSKISKSKRDMRRSHDSLVEAGYSECPNCGELKLSHHICNHCGYYSGKSVIEEKESV
ncbi:MAG: 50S ribosomal protein L32 [Rhodospirillaceae bacterium]|nr:50S ribosomal protein L32 [Rhodospirillaceae bacterium]|tara:strand:+ start:1802 stop:1987 length:186 start_codon:yes stop_codon:yes gene_type:complete